MHSTRLLALFVHGPLVFLASLVSPAQAEEVRTGTAALSGWKADAPGVRRHIESSDLPAPPKGTDPEKSVANPAKVIAPAQGALPKVPEGFEVQVFAKGFKMPRTLRVAPNGDVFLSESGAGRVLVFHMGADGSPANPEVFAENLDRPYGVVFYPPTDPRYVYVGAANQVVRYPYRAGNTKAAGPAEVIIDNIPTERHWTRDLAISRDGLRLFLAVGSSSNLGIMPDMTPEEIRRHEATHGRGAAWGREENRAVVRVFDPEGKSVRNYATGLRNCSGLAMRPGTDDLWGVVNERDHLGTNLVPDQMVLLKEGGFYGWPWYYVGDHEDPVLKGRRPDLKGEVRAPDVLIQAHSSALSLAFYDGNA